MNLPFNPDDYMAQREKPLLSKETRSKIWGVVFWGGWFLFFALFIGFLTHWDFKSGKERRNDRLDSLEARIDRQQKGEAR